MEQSPIRPPLPRLQTDLASILENPREFRRISWFRSTYSYSFSTAYDRTDSDYAMNSYFHDRTLSRSFRRLQANGCSLLVLWVGLAFPGIDSLAHAGDQRQWGQAWSRN